MLSLAVKKVISVASVVMMSLRRKKSVSLFCIDNFAQVPCGGTHVKSTRELGSIRLKRKNVGKGKERVEIYLV
ncbi:hypothetical protein [Marinomonas sp.]|uniref:hypothetical protein n=1 Tax=Marinomonas sp. TaxID=1904862 RepID=UPI003BAA8077